MGCTVVIALLANNEINLTLPTLLLNQIIHSTLLRSINRPFSFGISESLILIIAFSICSFVIFLGIVNLTFEFDLY